MVYQIFVSQRQSIDSLSGFYVERMDGAITRSKEDGSEAYFVIRFVMGWRREREVEERTLDDVGMDE